MRQADRREESFCPDVVREGVRAVVVVCYIVVFGALFGVFFFFIFILQHRSLQRGVVFSFIRKRVLYTQFVPSQLTRVHDGLVCLTFVVD